MEADKKRMSIALELKRLVCQRLQDRIPEEQYRQARSQLFEQYRLLAEPAPGAPARGGRNWPLPSSLDRGGG